MGFLYFVFEFLAIAFVIAELDLIGNEELIMNIFVYLIPITLLLCSIFLKKWDSILLLIVFIITEAISYTNFEFDLVNIMISSAVRSSSSHSSSHCDGLSRHHVGRHLNVHYVGYGR